jgi:hypothetical protein
VHYASGGTGGSVLGGSSRDRPDSQDGYGGYDAERQRTRGYGDREYLNYQEASTSTSRHEIYGYAASPYSSGVGHGLLPTEDGGSSAMYHNPDDSSESLFESTRGQGSSTVRLVVPGTLSEWIHLLLRHRT